MIIAVNVGLNGTDGEYEVTSSAGPFPRSLCVWRGLHLDVLNMPYWVEGVLEAVGQDERYDPDRVRARLSQCGITLEGGTTS
jgi:hypothetical protein